MIETPLFGKLGVAETDARELAQALLQQIFWGGVSTLVGVAPPASRTSRRCRILAPRGLASRRDWSPLIDEDQTCSGALPNAALDVH